MPIPPWMIPRCMAFGADIRDRFYGVEHHATFQHLGKGRWEWASLWTEFITRCQFSRQEFDELPARYIAEFGKPKWVNDVLDYALVQKFKAWVRILSVREDRVEKGKAAVKRYKLSGAISVANETAKMEYAIKKSLPKAPPGERTEHQRAADRVRVLARWRRMTPDARRATWRRDFRKKYAKPEFRAKWAEKCKRRKKKLRQASA